MGEYLQAVTAEARQAQIYERALKLGAGLVTFAALSAAVAWYERRERRQRIVAEYMSRMDVFEYDNPAPDYDVLHRRRLAAASLTNPQGVSYKELRTHVPTPGNIAKPFTKNVDILSACSLLEVLRDGRTPVVRPTSGFIASIVHAPDDWKPMIADVKILNPAFEPDQLRMFLPSEFLEDA